MKTGRSQETMGDPRQRNGCPLAPPIIGGKDGDFNSNRSLCFNWAINFDVTLELDNAVPFWITDDRAFESIGNAGIIILVVPRCPVKQKRIGGDRHIRKVEKEKTISRGPGAGRAYKIRSRSRFLQGDKTC